MVDKEVEEFVALCASILSDGEVTEEEAYQLADWLNHHDEAAEHWPGNQLVEPLREIWADGTASRRDVASSRCGVPSAFPFDFLDTCSEHCCSIFFEPRDAFIGLDGYHARKCEGESTKGRNLNSPRNDN